MTGKLPDIRFYDFDFNPLHVENQFVSSNWKVCYNDIGSFEAHFDLRSDTLPVIMENDYIVAVQGNMAAIIVGKKLDDDFTIYGRTCNWILTKRVTGEFPPKNNSDYDPVTATVLAAFSDSPVIPGDAVDVPPIADIRSDKCETFEVVQEILEQKNLGHSMVFKIPEKKWVFQLLQGNPHNPLVISTANRNAYDVGMSCDALDFMSEGLFKHTMENMGEWDPGTNKVTKDGIDGTAISNNAAANYGKCWKVGADGSRFNMSFKKGDYLICRQTSGVLQKSDNCDPFWVKIPIESPKTGIRRFEGILSGNNESEANASLQKAGRINAVQGKTAKVYFGREYALGDVVTVQYQTGKYKFSARKRIVGVNLWYETGNVGEEPVFEDIAEA